MAEIRGFFKRLVGGEPAPAEPLPAEPAPPVPAEPVTPADRALVEAEAAKPGWFQRLRAGLSRTSTALSQSLSVITRRKLDAEALDDLEDTLVRADLGPETAGAVVAELRRTRYDREITEDEIREVLVAEIERILAPVAAPLAVDPGLKPHVILVVGVNGTGKTTTIGKLAAKFRDEGKTVVLAAGDTFRAAAIEQLKIWGERSGATVIAGAQGADAAGLAFDALASAREKKADVLLIDTAGRLQNKDALMGELEKIVRVIRKLDPTAPHSVLLTLDATTGQNAISQVEIFGRRAGVTGLVMTKLDGTARGGILVAIAGKYRLPVHFIGVGEQVDDLEPFAADDFARAVAGL
jgi:fused signal recognition particle receptor